ncbi:hypothetical protein V6N13_057216 [Hibiscus sabdariffa]
MSEVVDSELDGGGGSGANGTWFSDEGGHRDGELRFGFTMGLRRVKLVNKRKLKVEGQFVNGLYAWWWVLDGGLDDVGVKVKVSMGKLGDDGGLGDKYEVNELENAPRLQLAREREGYLPGSRGDKVCWKGTHRGSI